MRNKNNIFFPRFALGTEMNSEVRCHGEEASNFGAVERREETQTCFKFFFSPVILQNVPKLLLAESRHRQCVDRKGYPWEMERGLMKM